MLVAGFFAILPVLIGGRTGGPLEWHYWQGLSYGSLLIGLALAPVGLLVNRATRFLGNISYSVYLGHCPAIYFLISIYRKDLRPPYGEQCEVPGGSLAHRRSRFPLSYLCYRFIEVPGIRAGELAFRWIRGWAAVAPPLVDHSADVNANVGV